MEYKYLRAFLTVADHLSFTAAAEELRIAQSAVSRQIKLLEESIGDQLIVRSPHQVTLTPVGKELNQELMNFDRWASSKFKRQKPRKIRIGSMQGVCENWLIKRLVKFYSGDLNPNLIIKVGTAEELRDCLLYTSPSPRDKRQSRMPSSA